jgi:chromosomal replication initiator protein
MHFAKMRTTSNSHDATSLAEVWSKIKERLRVIYGAATYQSWLQHLELIENDNSQINLSVPSRFIRDWISNHYLNKIEALWQDEISHIQRINLVIKTTTVVNSISSGPQIASGTDVSGQNVSLITPELEDKKRLSSQLDRRFTFDNFVVGKSNELAYAAAKAVAESTDTVAGSNPLFIYGGVGLGKTHLMHAIAWHIRQHQPSRRVVYLSAEKFMYQFIKALREKDVMSFKEQLRNIDVLMIDDVQFICGKDSTQEEFFHTFNALIDQGKQLIISGDRSPSDLESMEERIRSRLGWGLVTDINTTTYELRLGILQSKTAQMPDIHIPQDVLELMASNITSNIRELEGSLNKVVAHSSLMKRDITVPAAKEILSDILRANHKVLSIEEIQKSVAEYYGIKHVDMVSSRRMQSIARPRQIAMYLAKNLTTRSLSEIGRKFGGKDHTTIIHAVRRIESLSASDTELSSDLIQLRHRLI